LNAPYISNNKVTNLRKEVNLFHTVRVPMQGKNLTSSEVKRLIDLYTLPGYLKEYERTGKFVLPYSVDHPLTPAFEVINNSEYYYYQKLLWNLQTEKIITVKDDFKSV
jgi:hypothetical protein